MNGRSDRQAHTLVLNVGPPRSMKSKRFAKTAVHSVFFFPFSSVFESILLSKVSHRFLPDCKGFFPASSAATHTAHLLESAGGSLGGSSRCSTDISHPLWYLPPPPEKYKNRRWSQKGPLEILPLVPRDSLWFGQ